MTLPNLWRKAPRVSHGQYHPARWSPPSLSLLPLFPFREHGSNRGMFKPAVSATRTSSPPEPRVCASQCLHGTHPGPARGATRRSALRGCRRPPSSQGPSLKSRLTESARRWPQSPQSRWQRQHVSRPASLFAEATLLLPSRPCEVVALLGASDGLAQLHWGTLSRSVGETLRCSMNNVLVSLMGEESGLKAVQAGVRTLTAPREVFHVAKPWARKILRPGPGLWFSLASGTHLTAWTGRLFQVMRSSLSERTPLIDLRNGRLPSLVGGDLTDSSRGAQQTGSLPECTSFTRGCAPWGSWPSVHFTWTKIVCVSFPIQLVGFPSLGLDILLGETEVIPACSRSQSFTPSDFSRCSRSASDNFKQLGVVMGSPN